jgi:dipeptidyl-peptidase-4
MSHFNFKVFTFTAVALLAFQVSAQSQSEPSEQLSVEDVWQSGKFYGDGVYGIRSMADGTHYTRLESRDEQQAIVKYAYATGEEVEVIATDEDVFGDPNQEVQISGYEFSADEKQLLISTGHESIYRHSYTADFYVHVIKKHRTYPLSDMTLGKTRLASFSPEGDQVAFVRDNNVFIATPAKKNAPEIQVTSDGVWNEVINGASDWVYEEEFGKDNGIFWSPDGERLAYYRFDESGVREFSMPMYGALYPETYTFKYPKAGEDNSDVSIHIYNLELAQSIQVANTDGDSYIPRIQWTSNPELLCVTEMDRHQNALNLVGVNVGKDGAVSRRTLLSERCETYIPVHDNLVFLEDSKSFLWTSSKDGFNHLYKVSMKGKGKQQQLTSGAWDVGEVYGFDAERERVYFSSTIKGPTQKHLARVDLDGAMQILGEAAGSHGATYSRTFDYAIHTHSDAATPGTTVLRDVDWQPIRTLEDNARLKETLDGYDLSERAFFTFKNDAGVDLNAWMMKPANFDPTKAYPVYVAIYGGPGVNTVKDSWGGINHMWYNLLCQEGYIVASVDPRGTPGRGRAFEHSTQLQLGKLETEDFIDFAEYLSAKSYVDGGRIGIQGWSYGGYMTALCMTKGAAHYKAGICVAPVSNWRYYDSIYTERFMRTPQENPDGYDDNSPINHVDKMTGPFLLVHGSADDNVHFQNSMEMVDALIAAGVDFDFMAYPNRNHGIYGGNTRLHLFRMMLDFVKEHF